MEKKRDTGIKILSDNRQAGHLYFLSDRVEAGIVLSGTEVKSARDGKIQLNDAFGEVSDGEAWLMNAHIGQYSHGNIMNHEPMRRRKLLLHKAEIKRMQETTRERGLTIVPTKLYLKNGLVKVELAVGKGKKDDAKKDDDKKPESKEKEKEEQCQFFRAAS